MIKTDDIVNIGLPVETAFAIGLFDGLHIGHREVINNALMQKKNGFMTGVFTFSDTKNDENYFKDNFKYIFTQKTKENILEKMGIDYLVAPPFSDVKNYTCQEFVDGIIIKALNAKVISCGYDFTFGKNASGNAETLKELCGKKGIEVIIAPPVKTEGAAVSSTDIRNFILDGQMQEAAKLLGENFFIDFPVIKGNQIGKKILSFPTINQEFPKNHVVPRFGVYVTKVHIGDKFYVGATNVGVKPTVGCDKVLSETYINDYDGNLYGKNIKVDFLEFIRPETKFGSLDDLKAQIEKDKQNSLEVFKKYKD
ncbi:MAG: bifunctional riboflavin kinase/FAD synthetase [Oscillospiraceae bacterium]